MPATILQYKGLRSKALFRYLQLAKKRTKVVFSHRLSGTGMTSLISSAEMSDDCVQVCISCESQGLISLLAHSLVRYCQFGVSPVNHSDSEMTQRKACSDTKFSLPAIMAMGSNLGPDTEVSAQPLC